MKRCYLTIILLCAYITIKGQWSGTDPIYTESSVGIGTTNPYRKLHVYSTASPTHYYDGELIIGGFLGTNNDMALVLGTHRNNSVSTLQSWKGGYGGYRLSLNPMGGNVGIGTESPSRLLEIVGGTGGSETVLSQIRSNSTATNTATTLKFTNSTNSTTAIGSEVVSIRTNSVNSGDCDFVVRTSSGSTSIERLRILDNGNIGIRTPSPQKIIAYLFRSIWSNAFFSSFNYY